MEASGVVLQRAPVAGGERWLCGRRGRARPSAALVPGSGFADDGHMRYYVCCGGRKKEEKKRAKLMKGLEKGLSDFYSIGFGVEAARDVVAGDKNRTLSEAAEALLAQLKQQRAEEKEMKKKKKEEKAAMKATRMRDCNEDESSSSSSSESSDSECETVVKMNTLRAKPVLPLELTLRDPAPEPGQLSLNSGEECNSCSSNAITTMLEKQLLAPPTMDKIEVCMGGKCKRSGASTLLEELDKRVGIEGAVVGCKCMGKCRDGPNVRVLNHDDSEEGSVKPMRNPLCIGVGLEDVGAIVASFFGEEKDAGLLPV